MAKLIGSAGKFPLVFQMVCLPQVSKDFYHSKRLDVVLDESFTILKEDLDDTSSFYKKIDQALSEVYHWKRDPFDSKTMLTIQRSLDKLEILKKALMQQYFG